MFLKAIKSTVLFHLFIIFYLVCDSANVPLHSVLNNYIIPVLIPSITMDTNHEL